MRSLSLYSLLAAMLSFSGLSAQCGMNISPTTIPVTCNSMCNGSVSVSVTGGSAPYTYSWSTVPAQTGATATGLCAGSYTVVVTDAASCSQTVSIIITQPQPLTATIVNVTNATCYACNGSISTNSSGGTPPYAYMWVPVNSWSPNLTGLCSGVYTLTVTDANGCTTAAWANVNNGLSASGVVTHATCSDGAIDITPSYGTPPYSFLWSVGATTEDLQNIPPGMYTVTVTDAGSITCSASFQVNGSVPGPGCAYVTGKIYLDENTNCIFDGLDIPMQNEILMATPGPLYTSTDLNGNYLMVLPYGNFTISHVPQAPYGNNCPGPSISVTTSSSNNYIANLDFADTIPPWVDLQSYSMCPILRPGFNSTFAMLFSNNGNVPVSATAWFLPDDTLIFQSAIPAPSFINGDTIFWSIILPPLSNTWVHATCSVPANVALIGFQTINCSGIMPYSDMNPQNNIYCCDRIITASYDPNMKEVFPAGSGPQGFIQNSDSILTYTVHFQNTGTDTAFNIVVRDTLSPNLNPLTVEPLFASHPYTFSMSGNCVLKWTFNNILLPDSNVNEPGSHGYFQYRVRMFPNLQPGTQITNEADIYFDYNPPVITNQVLNTIAFPIGFPDADSFTAAVYPNPSDDVFNLQIRSANSGKMVLQVFDLTGRAIWSELLSVSAGTQTIKMPAVFNAGMYMLKLESGRGTRVLRLVRN